MNLQTTKESATNHNTTTTTNSNRSRRKDASECSNCGTPKGGSGCWPILHHVRLRGIDRLLCTSCVLRLHPSSFCPLCFHFFDHNLLNSHSSLKNPSNRPTVPCSKCSSLTHSHCLPASHSSSYLCPPCSNPKFSFFHLEETHRSVDRKLATVLLCASRIASASMSKAVIVARADAERKVREAAVAKKRAREALEHLVMVEAREKSSRKKVESRENGNVMVGSGEEKKKVEVVESMRSNGNQKENVNMRASVKEERDHAK
ncbi:uncharacterized protein LOC121259651 [Juglans microcarpa x Juglans regia]|uniref:uncharacterized protein LOC121259651 n=1 Tax=Juglans microcarpa x Juglans regia TaxID=2249226 RepID=UPI001B7F3820|nr:uncharacterized protein LOC121259651 [Juglans microcarpa x Juglans regia]